MGSIFYKKNRNKKKQQQINKQTINERTNKQTNKKTTPYTFFVKLPIYLSIVMLQLLIEFRLINDIFLSNIFINMVLLLYFQSLVCCNLCQYSEYVWLFLTEGIPDVRFDWFWIYPYKVECKCKIVVLTNFKWVFFNIK